MVHNIISLFIFQMSVSEDMKNLARPSQLGDLPPLVARWFLAPGKAVRGGADDVVCARLLSHHHQPATNKIPAEH